MAKFKLSMAGTALLLAWGALYAAEPAGRVLMLQGSAVALRAGQEVALSRGSAVESGDLVRVGEGSSAQLRFTDESIVALRANTDFKIEDYKFTDKGEGDKSILGLIKGGFRTITGLIGKRNPSAYAVRGQTATIGIRGTHFTMVYCAGNCFNADGSKAEDGLYGAVTDGRISVTNQAGESEFGRDQYFIVRSQGEHARPLLAPPAFMRDRLDGLARAGRSDAKPLDSQASAPSGDSTPSTSNTTSPAPTSVASTPDAGTVTTTYTPTSTPAAQTSAGGSATASTFSWNTVWSDVDILFNSVDSGSEQTTVKFSSFGGAAVAESPELYGFTQNGTGTMVDYMMQPSSFMYSDASGSYSYTKTASTSTGSSAAAGNAYWGRYEFSYTDNFGGSTTNGHGYSNWVLADPVTALPTSGIFAYTWVGGTSPIDQNGSVGTMTSGGAWQVNFGGASPTIQTTSSISWSMPNGASYYVDVPSQSLTPQTFTYSDPSGTFSSTSSTYSSLSSITSCFSPCITASSTVSPQFLGGQGQGLGVGIATTGTISAGVYQHIGSVQVYKR